MVALTEVRAANAALKQTHQSLTAVFTGATHGLGLATLQAFAKHIPNPHAIIVGRSHARFAPELAHLHRINPNGTYIFLEAPDLTLIKTIDALSARILSQLERPNQPKTQIDLLIMSQGYVSFAGREPTADGLDTSLALRYYTRVRLAQLLLPHLAPHARVLSILAGGEEGKIFEDDLDLERNYSIPNSMAQFASMMTLSWDHLARTDAAGRSYVHAFPGLVGTGLLGRSATGVLGYLFRWVVEPVMGLFAAKAEDVGERMLYYGTAEEFGPSGKAWAVDQSGTVKEVEVLKKYREQGWADKVWEHNQRVFERATAV